MVTNTLLLLRYIISFLTCQPPDVDDTKKRIAYCFIRNLYYYSTLCHSERSRLRDVDTLAKTINIDLEDKFCTVTLLYVILSVAKNPVETKPCNHQYLQQIGYHCHAEHFHGMFRLRLSASLNMTE